MMAVTTIAQVPHWKQLTLSIDSQQCMLAATGSCSLPPFSGLSPYTDQLQFEGAQSMWLICHSERWQSHSRKSAVPCKTDASSSSSAAPAIKSTNCCRVAQVFRYEFTALQSPANAAMLIKDWCVGLSRALPYVLVQMHTSKFEFKKKKFESFALWGWISVKRLCILSLQKLHSKDWWPGCHSPYAAFEAGIRMLQEWNGWLWVIRSCCWRGMDVWGVPCKIYGAESSLRHQLGREMARFEPVSQGVLKARCSCI